MRIQTLSDDTVLWRAIVRGQEVNTSKRAPGLHLSTILNDLAYTIWPSEFDYLKPKAEGEELAAGTRSLFECGNTLEDVMAQQLAVRVGWQKPEPRRKDGVWCSPDGHSKSTRTIDEMKVTWKSARGFTTTPKWQVYCYQVLAYMKAFGATRARLHVLHVNGDWRPPLPHPPKTYILRPTAQEIDENWAMVLRHAKDRGWLK